MTHENWKPGDPPEAILNASPYTRITPQGESFLRAVREHKELGYGWMQQVIEWEWQHKSPGAWGPEYFNKEVERLETEVETLQERVRDAIDGID